MEKLVYAGFWRRFAAMMIDGAIVLLPAALAAVVLPYVGPFLVVILYRPFFESSEAMTTPGKAFMELIVTNESGNRLSFKQAMIRFFASYVSSAFLFIGYFFNLFTPKRQTFHDIMAGALVVEKIVPASTDWIGLWTKQFKHVFNLSSAAVMGPSETAAGHGNPNEVLLALEQLHKLYTQGALTEEEYLAKKSDLLKKI